MSCERYCLAPRRLGSRFLLGRSSLQFKVANSIAASNTHVAKLRLTDPLIRLGYFTDMTCLTSTEQPRLRQTTL